MRFIRGVVIASWKLYPIPRAVSLKNGRLRNFCTPLRGQFLSNSKILQIYFNDEGAIMLSTVRLHLSVTRVGRVDQSKTAEVRIMRLSSSFCGISLIQKFWRVPSEQGRGDRKNKLFSSFMRRYLENGTMLKSYWVCRWKNCENRSIFII